MKKEKLSNKFDGSTSDIKNGKKNAWKNMELYLKTTRKFTNKHSSLFKQPL